MSNPTITINLDRYLAERAEVLAAKAGVPPLQWIEDALQEAIEAAERRARVLAELAAEEA